MRLPDLDMPGRSRFMLVARRRVLKSDRTGPVPFALSSRAPASGGGDPVVAGRSATASRDIAPPAPLPAPPPPHNARQAAGEHDDEQDAYRIGHHGTGRRPARQALGGPEARKRAG